jgi:hypothetical protein
MFLDVENEICASIEAIDKEVHLVFGDAERRAVGGTLV